MDHPARDQEELVGRTPPPVGDDRLRFERLLADLSARFVNLPPLEVDQEIEDGLRQIVKTLEVDRSTLMEFSEDGTQFIVTHSCAREGVPVAERIVVNKDLPWYTGVILPGETMAHSRLPEDLPAEAAAEKAYCARVGLRSNLTIPLRVSNRPLGALAIGCFRRERSWPLELIPRIRLLGEVFANALARRNQSVNLQQALTEVQTLKARLEEENLYLRKEIDAVAHAGTGIVGESVAIKRVLVQAQQVAPTDATVLLLGETGTGKELVARTVHLMSARQGRTMVKVNCAALPPTLIEAELFGRERGAYTGALARQTGRFEVADESTIFLDEIGDLPLELQTKLLRVLEHGEFERLGSNRTMRVDVRVIAATNRDLAAMVRAAKFREDLYYRLNVFPITLPPLRARAEDVPLLAWAFVREFAQAQGKAIEQIPRRTMEALQRYSWPGNVRELRNIVERATIVSPGPTLHVELPAPEDRQASTAMTLEAVERQHIRAVLEEVRWRIRGEGGAAQRLGLKPSTLEFRIRKLGIQR
ncbi:MAG: sigma-54-dependent Fis family transcriptional regulator [Candidatus Rokuibacteriota bacterium]